MNDRLEEIFSKPQGNIARYFSTIFIVLSGFGSIYIYFAIEYFLCVNDRCAELIITKTWVNTPVYFIVFGVCCLIVSAYIWRMKQLQGVFVAAIDILVGSGFLLFGKTFFAIAIEIGKQV